ncbi:hypothetical protein Pmani_037724 [Petrolisthes manimaculis]|uniref:Uncharacterized protein n=1 Tax=Petrolisthes manimaculis TaxID=1843537 RepID=A0AAE1NFU7_9EUCA|nr:hypothetical protein Pmani_037724 [Petrolisthes manimaculis]
MLGEEEEEEDGGRGGGGGGGGEEEELRRCLHFDSASNIMTGLPAGLVGNGKGTSVNDPQQTRESIPAPQSYLPPTVHGSHLALTLSSLPPTPPAVSPHLHPPPPAVPRPPYVKQDVSFGLGCFTCGSLFLMDSAASIFLYHIES